MSPRLLTVTFQAAALSALSNLLAQGLAMYHEGALSAIDRVALFQFVLISIVSTPPNYQWQLALEKHFPATARQSSLEGDAKGRGGGLGKSKVQQGKLSIPNTVAKFILDQTVGATANTLLFILMMHLLKGASLDVTIGAVRRDLIPMLTAGYKFWPLVTLANLVLVPVKQRTLFGGLAGLAWGIYTSLTSF